jgi:phage-related protein
MTREFLADDEKPLIWVGSSRKDLMELPEEVRKHLGAALGTAQFGGKHPDAKPWKGYTVRFAEAVYVLHTFQKKSKSGIKTPKADQDLIASRLKDAERIHRERFGGKNG